MVLKILTKCCPIPHTIFELCPKYKVVSSGGGGYFHMYAQWVCAARETPIFIPEFPFRSISLSQITKIPEHHHFTFFGGFCRSGGHHFQNFFNFNPFIASHGRSVKLKICLNQWGSTLCIHYLHNMIHILQNIIMYFNIRRFIASLRGIIIEPCFVISAQSMRVN